jgi:hypothetical protein
MCVWVIVFFYKVKAHLPSNRQPRNKRKQGGTPGSVAARPLVSEPGEGSRGWGWKRRGVGLCSGPPRVIALLKSHLRLRSGRPKDEDAEDEAVASQRQAGSSRGCGARGHEAIKRCQEIPKFCVTVSKGRLPRLKLMGQGPLPLPIAFGSLRAAGERAVRVDKASGKTGAQRPDAATGTGTSSSSSSSWSCCCSVSEVDSSCIPRE